MVKVFSATFNNNPANSWRSLLLVKKTGENHRPVACHCIAEKVRISVTVFNATFNSISVISWRSTLLMEETGVREKIRFGGKGYG
jgi:hypothetical protein